MNRNAGPASPESAAPTTTAPTGADNYVMRRDDGQNVNAYDNPIAPIQVADSGATTTDVAPGLLAGSGDANANQTPSVEPYKLKSGDSYWNIARNQLAQSGANPTDADIQRQVYALMEMNPGLDPRTLQAGQTINLISPNSGTTISAGTLAAYGDSNADYQADRELKAQLAQAQEAMAVRAAASQSSGYNFGITGGGGWTDTTPTASVNTAGMAPRTLPPLDQSLYVPEGYIYQSYQTAKQEAANPNNTLVERGVNLVLGTLVAPLALAEEYIGRPVANIPYAASQGGQYLARAGMQQDSSEAVLDTLRAISSLSQAFVAAGSVVAPVSELRPAAAAFDATATEAAGGAGTVANTTTPVIGRLADTSAYANKAGFEIMNPVGWSPEANAAWIQGHIEAGSTFKLASPVTEANILSTTNASGFTVYADEISTILKSGYTWVGEHFIPPR